MQFGDYAESRRRAWLTGTSSKKLPFTILLRPQKKKYG